jgi:hypothetical protein
LELGEESSRFSNVPVDDVVWQAADTVQRRQRRLDGVGRVLFAEARLQPVSFIVEDLHWAR